MTVQWTPPLSSDLIRAHLKRTPSALSSLMRRSFDDKMAEKHGVSKRTQQRGDRDGAPYRMFGGVKYRPEKRYDQFILDSIQPQSQKRKARKRA